MDSTEPKTQFGEGKKYCALEIKVSSPRKVRTRGRAKLGEHKGNLCSGRGEGRGDGSGGDMR